MVFFYRAFVFVGMKILMIKLLKWRDNDLCTITLIFGLIDACSTIRINHLTPRIKAEQCQLTPR